MNPRLDGVSADVVRHTRLLLLDTLGEGLGFRWEITNSYFKPYPCARWIHPALDALSRVLAEVPRPADTIAELSVETFAFVASLDDPDPSFDLHARFSGPYCAAALAYDGLLDAGSFLPEKLAREEVRELARGVRLIEVEEHTTALPLRAPHGSRCAAPTGGGRRPRSRTRAAIPTRR